MNRIYYLTHLIAILTAIVYVFLIAPKFKIRRLRAAGSIALALLFGYILMRILYYIFTGEWTAQNTVRLVAFIPLIALAFSKMFKLPKDKYMDMVSPVICICQGIAKFGCHYVGCCKSNLKVSWGVYNRFTHTTLFPIQLAESAVSLVIAIVLIIVILKKKGETDGLLMPKMLVAFGLTRFILEFFRDNEKILWGLSEFSFWSILIFLVGLVWLIIKMYNGRNREVI